MIDELIGLIVILFTVCLAVVSVRLGLTFNERNTMENETGKENGETGMGMEDSSVDDNSTEEQSTPPTAEGEDFGVETLTGLASAVMNNADDIKLNDDQYMAAIVLQKKVNDYLARCKAGNETAAAIAEDQA